jgi:hypothetical protein
MKMVETLKHILNSEKLKKIILLRKYTNIHGLILLTLILNN